MSITTSKYPPPLTSHITKEKMLKNKEKNMRKYYKKSKIKAIKNVMDIKKYSLFKKI